MLLNCDLGESVGDRPVGDDAAIMPFIDQANIACGFHGGDPLVMRKTIELAKASAVLIGAHPSYPDREGFGRTSMSLPREELIGILHYQVAALDGMARSLGCELSHIKPHGALYNDMMRDKDTRRVVLEAVASYHRSLPLVLQATPGWRAHMQEAQESAVQLQFEAFADRRYLPDGRLMPRSETGAVLDGPDILAQTQQLLAHNAVTASDGTVIPIHAQTLCLHGDTPAAPGHAAALRDLLKAVE